MNAVGGGELELLEGGGADATGALLGRYASATDSWDLPIPPSHGTHCPGTRTRPQGRPTARSSHC